MTMQYLSRLLGVVQNALGTVSQTFRPVGFGRTEIKFNGPENG